MHSQARLLTSLFRTCSLAVIAALVMAVVMAPAWAQNSVPPTAVQAAKMPQFASRLAHPLRPQASRKAPAPLARARAHRGPQDSVDIYDNGPTNGNTDAWNIGFGFIVSDSFTVANGGATVTGMTFAAWTFPGDVLANVDISITSAENGGTVYMNQTTVSITQSGCVTNSLGFDICNETTSAFNIALNSGTYWVNLQNGEATDGDSVYWDENSGPSSASATSIGTIPSESFTILGNATTTTTSTTSSYDNYSCPPAQNGFRELHDFGAASWPAPSGGGGRHGGEPLWHAFHCRPIWCGPALSAGAKSRPLGLQLVV